MHQNYLFEKWFEPAGNCSHTFRNMKYDNMYTYIHIHTHRERPGWKLHEITCLPSALLLFYPAATPPNGALTQAEVGCSLRHLSEGLWIPLSKLDHFPLGDSGWAWTPQMSKKAQEIAIWTLDLFGLWKIHLCHTSLTHTSEVPWCSLICSMKKKLL